MESNVFSSTNLYSLRSDPCYDRLEDVIRQACGKSRVYYMPNAGNWGDALIREGTIAFLRDRGIAFREIRWRNKFSLLRPLLARGVLLYGGSGAWSNCCMVAPNVIRRIRKLFIQTVVLPSTYQVEPRYADVFFRRGEGESAQWAPHAEFAHDMAFYLSPDAREKGQGACTVWRGDNESDGIRKSVYGTDLGDISSQGIECTPVDRFFQALRPFETVYTDRLHVGIGASLLGKEVFLKSGNYFKIREIFEASMAGRFERCHLVESLS